MAQLIFNEVLRIAATELNGLFRVVASSPDGEIQRLGYIGPLEGAAEGRAKTKNAVGALETVARQSLHDWRDQRLLRAVEIRPAAWMLVQPEAMPAKTYSQWDTRVRAASQMLDALVLQGTVGLNGTLADLIRRVCAEGKCSRAQAHNLWKLLIEFGFAAASLVPRFERCGAPGVPRPVTAERKKAGRHKSGYASQSEVPNPQRGVTEADRVDILHHYRTLQEPGLSGTQLYDKIVEAVYVREYEQKGRDRIPVLPPQGSFPNRRQVRHIIEFGVGELERVLRKTTVGHFNRSLRGMRGRSFDGVPGPGHTYAIDSTIGDIYLRSAINAAWIIGRPIVYVIVDVYSTAVVGFYACLEGPSWRDAKLALFSSLCDSTLATSLLGFSRIESLWPHPSLPHCLRCDRGEYLSAGARETARALALNSEFAPPRRPDWKGSVEVLHRIAKDAQYPFLPGAFDARRRELELRQSRPRESAMNLREYAQILHEQFSHYNLYADRSDRLTSEMIGADIEPTPAGLWRFGHDAGFGLLRSTPHDLLAVNLLPRGTAAIRRNGVFFESLEYAAAPEVMQSWTGRARNFGAMELPVHYYPHSTSRVWWNDPGSGLSQLDIRGNARAPGNVTFYDWRDALMADRKKQDDRAYRRLQAALGLAEHQRGIADTAIKRTRRAEEGTPAEAMPAIREARVFERMCASGVMPAAGSESDARSVPIEPNEAYGELMDSVFAEMNREDHG